MNTVNDVKAALVVVYGTFETFLVIQFFNTLVYLLRGDGHQWDLPGRQNESRAQRYSLQMLLHYLRPLQGVERGNRRYAMHFFHVIIVSGTLAPCEFDPNAKIMEIRNAHLIIGERFFPK